MTERDVVTGHFLAPVKSKSSPSSFTYRARFVIQRPQLPNEIAEHDRQWLDFIDRKTRKPRKRRKAKA